jgi:hypothetical protein
LHRRLHCACVERFEQLADLDVTDPDAMLAQVRKDTFAAATTPEQRRNSDAQITSAIAGAMSQGQGATASNHGWNEITTPLFQCVGIQRRARDARMFVSNHWPHVRCVARALASERTLPVGQAAWLLDSKPHGRVA